MIKKLIPVFALLIGLASGAGAALVLGTGNAEELGEAAKEEDAKEAKGEALEDIEIVKLPNQFVVPVITNKRVMAFVILTLAVEVDAGTGDLVRSIEPKLRDMILGELFGLAALGGFNDQVISRKTLELVKVALTKQVRVLLDQKNANVLVTDMARQDP